MTPTWIVRHHRSVVAAAMVLWGGSLTGFVALVVVYDLDFLGPVGGPWILAFSVFAITGALITWQRPEHVMGPLFLLIGIVPPLANGMAAAALGAFADHSLLLRSLFAAAGVAANTAYFPLLPIAIVMFPDGRLPSSRWRWFTLACAVASVVGAATAFLTGAWGGDEAQTIVGPPFEGTPAAIGLALSPVYHGLIAGLMIVSAGGLVLRYRHSDATTRRQIRWLVLAVLFLVVLACGVILLEFVRGESATLGMVVAISLGIALVPISVTIAILRHRLFDIDVALNRTIVFGSLAVFITGLYVAVVVGVGTIVGDPSNLALTVGATALVAVAFEPVRARVQHWANVAVYGQRASPYEVLATIADELGAAGADDVQLEAMAALLADGTGASHTTVWVAIDEHLRAAACWPPHDPAEHPPMPSGDVRAASAAGSVHLEPVHQDGEPIGALSLERRRDDPVTPREQRLVAELAGQASLVLGNARLRARLQARLEELRASRQRLVATQDEARRRLERDLHDGAQQQLVALKVKLGMARTIAAKEDAGNTVVGRLEELSATADLAVDGLRSLARGIYPPLLEAEGLERAISAQVGRVPIHVSIRADGVQRYSRDVEATIYFCVVEALGNTLRHADATFVEITLEDRNGHLGFSLTDDGCGFERGTSPGGLGLRNMADRIEALGGSLTVTAAPGAGVRIDGVLPSTAPVAMTAGPSG
ncbi:MAG: hypothetical protein EA388_10885 [Nitriliruptor sp.]|nr:MAG: hypothetical protein EA388_10885 [Nitriliruptor sp.]